MCLNVSRCTHGILNMALPEFPKGFMLQASTIWAVRSDFIRTVSVRLGHVVLKRLRYVFWFVSTRV
jgi:hypothetical protein